MDLNVEDVAELLQVSQAHVKRLIVEGKIPAYQINREYRFNRDEIEDWMLRQKSAVNPQKGGSAPANLQFGLYRALNRGGVIELPEAPKEELIALAMQEMASRYDLDAAVLTDLFIEREQRESTSIGSGIAVPHTRDFLLPNHFDAVLIGFPKRAIEYGTIDGEPVHTLFFLLACDDKNHLHLLSKIARFCLTPDHVAFLKGKPAKEPLLDTIKEWENGLASAT